MKRHKFYDERLHIRILDFLLLTPFGYVLTSITLGFITGAGLMWWLK